MLREGIATILAGEPDLVPVAEATNGREAVEQFRVHRPDVTLMDLQMPVMNGNDAILAIRADFPNARIIVLTTYSGDARAAQAFKAGAAGYLLKGKVRKELAETIRRIYAGENWIPTELVGEAAEYHRHETVNDRAMDSSGARPPLNYLWQFLSRLRGIGRNH
jgi:DNA-binding NarL/FixJ family response regulator